MSLITYLTRIHFADRVLEDALAEEITRNRVRRPLVICDGATAGSDGFERLCDALPTGVAVMAVTTHGVGAANGSHEIPGDTLPLQDCDGLIGFGGKAALDWARLAGGPGRPVIAIPTRTETVGLGPVGGTTPDAPNPRPRLPVAILCDATLTLDASPRATAAAGIDALVHCLESFLSTAFNPPADGIALDGLRRAVQHLETAVQNGRDILARREMLAAALNAGLAGEKGYGGVEAASRGLEETVPARHGTLHGALLCAVLRFNAPAISQRYALIRNAIGLPEDADLGQVLTQLAKRVGLPLRLSEMGVHADALPDAARLAAADIANRTNPRLATARDYETMMRAAL